MDVFDPDLGSTQVQQFNDELNNMWADPYDAWQSDPSSGENLGDPPYVDEDGHYVDENGQWWDSYEDCIRARDEEYGEIVLTDTVTGAMTGASAGAGGGVPGAIVGAVVGAYVGLTAGLAHANGATSGECPPASD